MVHLRRNFSFVVLGLLCACVVGGHVQAEGASPSEPRKLIESTVEKVRTTVMKEKDSTSPEVLDAKLREIISPAFNFEEMAKASLGAQWHAATAEQRSEFVTLFSDLLARTYLKKIRDNIEDSTIKVVADVKRGPTVLVKTEVESSKDTTAIHYSMCDASGSFKVCDVIVENIGLVSNYRQEFGGIIKKEGFPALLTRLREKSAKKG